MIVYCGTINFSGINSTLEFSSPSTEAASEGIRRLLLGAFTRPIVSFDLETLFHIVSSRNPSSWLRHVASPNRFLEFTQSYVSGCGKWEGREAPAVNALAMRDLIEAFAEGDVSFETMMGPKSAPVGSDGRILSVADRISGRFALLYDPNARCTEDNAHQWMQRWVESVDKDDRGFLDNVHKFLIPNAEGNGLVELSRGCTDEQRALAYTTAFYTLFIADFATSSYPGAMPVFDAEGEKRLKIEVVQDILARKQLDVLFVQEPVDLEAVLHSDTGGEDDSDPPDVGCVARVLRLFGGSATATGRVGPAQYQLHNRFSRHTAIFLSNSVPGAESATEVDCGAYLGDGNPMVNGCTAVLLRPEAGEPYLLLAVHVRSIATVPGVHEGLDKIVKGLCSEHSVNRVVIGVDANVDLINSTPGPPTSVKQRNFLQYQLAKAMKEECVRKDFIMMYNHADQSMHIKQEGEALTEVRTASGLQQVSQDPNSHVFLPTTEHPFDHYLVSSAVDV
jgi:hypothetical protein